MERQEEMPPAIAALPTRIKADGTVQVSNKDFARVMGTDPPGLRRWRSRGAYAIAASEREGNIAWYDIEDVVRSYRLKYPAAESFVAVARDEPAELDAPRQIEVLPSDTSQAEAFGRAVGEQMRAAISDLAQTGSEKDAVIASLIRQLEEARREIDRLRAPWWKRRRL